MPELTKKPKLKKVRIRLDYYDAPQYRPFPGLSKILPLASMKLHAPLWRELVRWIETGAWRKGITPKDRSE